MKKVKDMKQQFDKCSNDLDTALLKNSQIIRSKSQESEEMVNVLSATHSCFCHVAVDYVTQVCEKLNIY